ncbi:Neuropeptide Y receptor type 6-like protein [Leptotrombidium deliense]|uniref:Neuropeptide Y receptor type 6-like protein n=1 Tax=Leptotrombidium deliense TaxID=299467 RepID=A0A443STY3_9ACAR|nr:Neuropeptide Y receptor type 6-like protein [Leptotrombidium deliense]
MANFFRKNYYILPTITVSVSYICICNRLNNRMVEKTKFKSQIAERREKDRERVNRTNLLLRFTAIIFGISWLPLNILNIVSDSWFTFENESTFRIVFACCHMIGMSSACSNPLLYGWLNDNFRKEFKEILAPCSHSSRDPETEVVVLSEQNNRKSVDIQQPLENGNVKRESVVVTKNF